LNEVFARLIDPGILCFSKIAKGIKSLTAKAPGTPSLERMEAVSKHLNRRLTSLSKLFGGLVALAVSRFCVRRIPAYT